MHIGKRLFPYPILNNDVLYSQYKTATFSLLYSEIVTKEEYILDGIKCDLNSNFLKELINKDVAKIICIVECAETMYRKSFSLSCEPKKIIIPLTELNGKVSVSAFVVATEDIEEYVSDDFLDDYEGYTFQIEKNDILAVDDGYVNRVDFNKDEDTKKSSIFIVIKDKTIKDETMTVEFDVDKIIVKLPEEQWNIYDKMKRIQKYQSLFFSILATPALGQALLSLKLTSDSVDQLKLDYKWFNSFAVAYKNVFGEELTDEIFEKMSDTNLIAQKLLNTPVTKAIDDLFQMTIGQIGGNDDGD